MWSFAWMNLATRPTRTVLAVLGLTIPVLAFLGLFSLTGGIHHHWPTRKSRTDGLVSYESAHVAGAASEKLVSAGHLGQDCPEVIGEVRRILREHLADTGGADRVVSLPGARPRFHDHRRGVERG